MAIFAVIVIHTKPFAEISTGEALGMDLATILNQLSRFAVPFLFVLSGFFWAAKFDGMESIKGPSGQMISRTAILFVTWSLFYLLPTNLFAALEAGALGPLKVLYWNISSIADHPLSTALQGPKVHLWFLFSLVCCVSISAICLASGMLKTLMLLSIIFYTIGVTGGAYQDSPIGFVSGFNFRNGPFFGLVFFVTGYLLQRRGPSQAWFIPGIFLAVFGAFLHLLEVGMLNRQYGTTMIQDFAFGTLFAGVGVSLMALSDHPRMRVPSLAKMGPLVLGIYALHYCFIDLLSPVAVPLARFSAWGFVHPILIFALSTLGAYGLSLVPFTRRFVT